MGGINTQGKLERLLIRLDRVLATSPLVASLRKLSQAQARLQAGRPLSPDERRYLESRGNTCPDWSRVRIMDTVGLDTIQNNGFAGDVLLSGFQGEWASPNGRTWPMGMANCHVRDAIIGNACLYHIDHMERQVIEDGAFVVGLGELDCPKPTLFSLGQAIHPGTESGARSVWIWDELTLEDCVDALSLPAEAQRIFEQKLDEMLAPLRSSFGFIGSGASVSRTRRIHGAWIGPGTTISGASLIREAALLSGPEAPCVVLEDGWIDHSLLQPGAHVESSGKLSHSVLLDHASVTWNGMVIQSVVGPDTAVSKGEMTSCLVGPMVGFHHQSLLISALWPEGRGNIAYGANVGSNHTGRKPDQEIRPGEGSFFGLGCSIKFPANYEDAPYSIFAAGVTTLPQRLGFPFSLINQPLSGFPEVDPAINEITPGWMWSDNAYALVRRSYKFEDADWARHRNPNIHPASTLRGGFFTSRIFLPDFARMVLKASQALHSAPPDLPYYLEAHIPGLGKNFLRHDILKRAQSAYADYLVFFLMSIHADRPWEAWPAKLQELVISIGKELGMDGDARTFLAEHKHRIPAFRADILASVARDDRRGRQIFDDYSDFHSSPEEDRTMIRLDEDLDTLAARLDAFIVGG